jgi:hypothetical protein
MRVSIALCVLALAACDGASPSRDGGPSSGDGGPPGCGSVPFDGAPSGALRVGELESDVFVSFDDDPTAGFMWGFQGGTMILPTVGVPLDVAGDERCFLVTIRHLVDPAAPDAFGETADFPQLSLWMSGAVEGDAVWIEPLQDQIAWDSPEGTRMRLEVTVRGVAFAASHTVAIEIVSDAPAVCVALERTGGGGGCSYRRVPGEAVVTEIGPDTGGGSTCTDPQRVVATFEPTDPATEVCYSDWWSGTTVVTLDGYRSPPASCLGAIAVGSRIPAVLSVIEGGTCQPTMFEFDLPGCDADCPL